MITGALVLSCTACMAQRIKADNTAVDVGQVEYCRPATAVFALKNTGRRPLSIYKVDTGCNCSEARYPVSPVPAGDKFTLSVTYDARMMGHFDKIIEVHSNGSEEPLLLEMRGVVVEEVEDYAGRYPFQLGELTADCNAVDFDDVRKGETISQRFHIFNPTSRKASPQIMHLPPYLRAEVSPSDVAPGRSALVTLTLDSGLMHDYGFGKTQVYLGFNMGERVSADKAVNVAITLLPPVRNLTDAEKALSPSLILSSSVVKLPVADGKKKTGTVDIQNVGKTALEIYSMRMVTEGVQVSLSKRTLSPGETGRLKIKTDPKQLKNASRMPRIVLITNDPEQPKVTVDVDIN